MPTSVATLQITVAASFTAEPLSPIFDKLVERSGHSARVLFAPFNQVLQQLLDPASLLASNRGGMNIVLVRAKDLAVESVTDARAAAREVAAAVVAAASRDHIPLLVCACPELSGGEAADLFAADLASQLEGVPGVEVLAAEDLARLYPVPSPFDPDADEVARVPYSEPMFAAMATWLARRVAAWRRKPLKVIAVDCDHTLWSGVCGEAGPRGVVIEPERRAFQEFLLEKRAEGFLLCMVSKNNAEDVEAVFRDHPDMLLPRGAFADAAVDWEPKSANLRALAWRLNVGLESILFLDDNPAEIAEVAANAPAVLAIRVPDDAAALADFARHLWVLDRAGRTGEDAQRADFYQNESRRDDLRARAASFEEFIGSLELVIDFQAMTAADAARASQLTQRTNQFNASPLPRDEAAILDACGGTLAQLVRARDRFGDYGVVGLMLGDEAGGRLRVGTFLLSCRALGKGVEHRMLRRLGELALERGLGAVAIVYQDSGRNQPCRTFLESIGDGSWEDGLRVIPAAVAVECRLQATVRGPETLTGEATMPSVDPAWVALSAGELSRVEAIMSAMRDVARPRPELGEPFAAPLGEAEEKVAIVWREVLGLESVGRNDRFIDLGGSSLQLVRVHAALQKHFGRRFELVRLFEHPTVAAQALLATGHDLSPGIVGTTAASREANHSAAVAIIGMAVRLPGASTPEELWQNLRGGVESITHFDAADLEVPGRDGEALVCARGLLEPEVFEGVDGGLFGIVPREAEMIDPQQRVFLEICWEAVERAGYVPDNAEAEGCRIGVYAGCYYDTYLPHHILSDPEMHRRHLAEAQVGALQVEFGNDKDHIATRVAFKLNLHGPSLTVQTACSTSLVAVAHAMMALRTGQCDMALAGGVTITVPQKRGYNHVEGGMLSPDGHCRPFDERSAGTVFSNGAGVVMLKRLDDAIRDGDHIHAVLRGFGLNNDGGVKHSYAAPSADGQADVIRRAHLDAGVDPRTITSIEAHGTATPLGDPIEIAGLTAAFRSRTGESGFCAIGSLKSNLGHLDTAAGVCGLIKTALSLEHRELPPVLHFNSPNPRIDFASSPFFVNDRLRPWEPAPGSPRRAGVSSFGVGGTNAHVIVEEAPTPDVLTEATGSSDRVLLFSARDEAALDQFGARLASHAAGADDADFAAAARTLALGRKTMTRRAAVVAGGWSGVADAIANGGRVSATAQAVPAGLVWMFPGQGAQHPGMTADLYAAEKGFREDIDQCAELLVPLLGEDLREVLFAAEGGDAAERLKHTVLAQPAIFTVEYALARQWQRWGLQPELMLGHSVGEFAAACLAGVFSLEDGLRILAARGRLMAEVERGSMLSVRLPAAELRARLPEELDMASENGPSLCVVAGATEAVARFAKELEADGVAVRELHTSHAFHSRMMDPVVARFREVIATVKLSAPRIPILSTVSGAYLTDEDAVDPGYWAAHLRRTVLFHQAVDAAANEKEGRIFLEVGPGQTLTTLARQTAGRRAAACFASCEHPVSGAPDRRRMLTTLAELWCRGAEVDWAAIHAETPKRRVPLPTYPFQRRRAWLPCRLLDQPLPAASVTTPASDEAPAAGPETTAEPAPSADGTAARLRQALEDLSGIPASDMTSESGFLELGFDSLLLTQAARVIQNTFGVAISFRDLMQTMPTIGALVAHLEANGVVLAAAPAAASKPAKQALAAPNASAPEPESGVSGPRTRIDRTSTSAELTPVQREHLDALTLRYNARTKGSKELTQGHRKWLADPRTVNGFNRLWKEMVYQIVARRMKGCKMWDVDGNEYVDMVNGFGPNFLGHSPDYVSDAIREQLATGLEIGPQCEAAMETAKLFCEVTGNDRVCFLNTGSEAVQAAMRIARTVTGRDKVLVFDKDYHGNFDPVLVRSVGSGAKRRTLPLAPGIPASAVQDVIVVPWGKPEALDMIREVAGELAAVLVEPVQSRQPEWIPVDFVHEVKRIAEEHGFLMVFDEVITGLRQGTHGAQDIYQIKPDIATYGKVFGGGALPIGIIAGKAEYMDTFDGGSWQYGDDSFPEKEVTFFAGTFVRLPLAMAACRAVLNHLKEKGPEYWDDIGIRATRLATTVDRMFRDNGIDIRMVNTGSQMYLRIGESVKHGNLIFYHLREKGVFAMEGLPFYLTAEHTDADVDLVIDAFRRGIAELQDGGFFPKPPRPEGVDAPKGTRGPFPMTEPMVEIHLAAMLGRDANLAFNEMLQLRLHGQLDGVALRMALQDLVDRHDALRMRIPAGHGTAFVIDPVGEVMILTEDFSKDPEPERALSECGLRQRETPFDLAAGPLFRVVVARMSEDEHVLQFAAHHIACDGWSFEVLIRDFTSCYETRKRGRAPLLSPPPSIVDRALREASSPVSDESALVWWRERFAKGVAELELPLRRSYGTVPGYSSPTCERVLDREALDRLRKLAGGCGVTLNSALLAGFQALLHRLSGQEEFVIAFPTAGQMEGGEEKLVGHCVNFLPLPATVNPLGSFKELASRVSGEQFDAIEHGKVTYGRLLRELKVRRDGGRRPLVEYIFNFEPSGDPGSFGGLSSKVETVPARYSNSTIFLNAMQTPDGLLLSSTYNHTLIDPGTMGRWLDSYCNLLLAAAGNPTTPVGDLDLLDDKGRAELTGWGEGADAVVSGSVADAFRATCSAHAGRTALAWEGGSWTYSELAGRVAAYAIALVASGVKPGDAIGVCLRRGPDAIAALLGVLEAGGCYVPLDPEWPDGRLSEVLQDARAGMWIAGREAPVAGVATFKGVGMAPALLPASVPRGPDDPAYVMFTSGSTGKPKGVVVPQRGILRLVCGADYCDLGPEEVLLQGSTLAFDASTFEVFGALLNGGKLVLPGHDSEPDVLGRMIREHGVTTLWFSAGLFELMVEEHLRDLGKVRQILTGGEAPSVEHLRRAFEALPEVRLINGYGPTENTTFTCCHTVREMDLASHVVPIGRPISGSRVRIVDAHGLMVPVGMPGELHCGGTGLALGYLGEAELTAERFIDGGKWYRSGDLCRWTADGLVEFLGRIDEQVKVRGFRIEPGEIEAVLAGHPAVRQCKVATRGSGAAGKRLLAWYVPVEGIKVGRGEIRDWLAERLPSFMLPDGIDEVAVMPLNANGKVAVAALPDPLGHVAERAESMPPTGEAEQKLAAIWSEVLGVDSIFRDDEFFELGGNSLAGLRMFARIGREFGVSLPLATLLHARTVRDLARVIESGNAPHVGTEDIGHIAKIRSSGNLPPIFAIHGGDGGVLFYEELARRLPEDRPFLAIESPDLSTSEEIRVESIEVTARNYIGLLRQLRPQGPYLLTGYSFGGVVAYEMAAQLAAAGEEIEFLGLIDTVNPAVPVREFSLPERVSVFWKSREDEPLLGRLQSLAQRFRSGIETNLRVRTEDAAAGLGPAEAHSELRGVQLREAHYQAMLAYTPKIYRGRVTLFRASEKSDKFDLPADYGWPQVAADFRIVDVPGDHLTVFNRENIPALSRCFGESLPGRTGKD
jgi:amino acid adenylation domain-containing protein/FkbH-like protein